MSRPIHCRAEQDWVLPRFDVWSLSPQVQNHSTLQTTYHVKVQINRLVWPEDQVEHVTQHGVTTEEVEQVCFGRPRVRRSKSEGENPAYYLLGQTDAGRYLFCVVIGFPDGNGYPVTARPMTTKEKRQYRQWKQR